MWTGIRIERVGHRIRVATRVEVQRRVRRGGMCNLVRGSYLRIGVNVPGVGNSLSVPVCSPPARPSRIWAIGTSERLRSLFLVQTDPVGEMRYMVYRLKGAHYGIATANGRLSAA